MAKGNESILELVEDHAPPPVPGAGDAVVWSHLGASLRATREESGRSLPDVSHGLKIRLVYLEAIEEGRFDDLPGAAYATGFVRAYAEHLGLDSDEVVRRFREEVDEGSRQPELVFPIPVSEGLAPSRAILWASLVLAAGGFASWYYLQGQERIAIERVTPVPPQIAATTGTAEPAPPIAVPAPVEAEAPAPVEAEAASEPASEPAPAFPVSPTDVWNSLPQLTDTGHATGSEKTLAEPLPEARAPAVEASSETATASESAPAPDSAADPAIAAVVDGAAAADPSAAELNATSPSAAAPVSTTESGNQTIEVRVLAPIEPEAAPEAVSETALAPAAEPSPEVAAASGTASEMAPGSAAPEPPQTAAPPPPQVAALSAVTAPDATTRAAVGDGQIELRARLDSYVQIRDPSDDVVYRGVLRAGASYAVPDQVGLLMMTGNAGALDILVDGEPVPTLGPVGAIRRDVALDPGLLRSGNAVR